MDEPINLISILDSDNFAAYVSFLNTLEARYTGTLISSPSLYANKLEIYDDGHVEIIPHDSTGHGPRPDSTFTSNPLNTSTSFVCRSLLVKLVLKYPFRYFEYLVENFQTIVDECVDREENTLLHYACMRDDPEFAARILDVAVRNKKLGYTTSKANVNVVQLVNKQNLQGILPIHYACMMKRKQTVRMLLEHGACVKIDAASKKGHTALYFAAISGSDEVVELLLEFGAAAAVSEAQQGESPYEAAQRCGKRDVIAVLDKWQMASSSTPSLTSYVGNHTISLNSFKLESTIHSGIFSTVYLVRTRGGKEDQSQLLVLKSFDKEQLQKANKLLSVLQERWVHSSLIHPNIVRMLGAFHDATNTYFVMEYCSGGTLANRIAEKAENIRQSSCSLMSREEIKTVVFRLLDALQFIHQQGIAHRDLTPDNVLFRDSSWDSIALGDFGSCVLVKGSVMHSSTPKALHSLNAEHCDGNLVQESCVLYSAPEVLIDNFENTDGNIVSEMEGTSYSSNTSSDLWSLGCLLFFMMTGKSLFLGSSPVECYEKIRAHSQHGFHPTDLASLPEIAPEALDVIGKLLTLNPVERLGYGEMLAQPPYKSIRDHPFFWPDNPG